MKNEINQETLLRVKKRAANSGSVSSSLLEKIVSPNFPEGNVRLSIK